MTRRTGIAKVPKDIDEEFGEKDFDPQKRS